MDNWSPLWLSLWVATSATLLAAVAGIGLAYVLAKGRFRGRGLLEALATLPIVLPPTVLGYYLLTVLGVNSPIGQTWERWFGAPLVFTPTAAVIAASISALPFVVRTGRAAIEEVDPRLEAAARVAGHREWRVATLVTLPVARRGLLAGVALGFARALGDFGATVMVAGNIPGHTQTLPIAVYDSVQAGDGSAARTGALILAGIAVVVLLAVTTLSARRI
ncbi:molybdate ABC transporter permease subunit [Demequina sp. TTPB684]|uniref:molybdate ABC transporter permease subunit n=1 Tax=unclassified Demequina TaxID=2620311 RepID=UPI001CF380B3|nr:molybdate ABC transporter permease subunit [Demequina sp. TMPB413]MCB2412446.1 molybdate ABC transporter permease subunit [Demequina sp. TTPB684]UPU88938.1 molybdate ABC transporter permease subunit [Demequina sp. TMPB413]